jgi:hypothetical protein
MCTESPVQTFGRAQQLEWCAKNTFQRIAEQRKSGDQQYATERFHDLSMARMPAGHPGESRACHDADDAQCYDHGPLTWTEPFGRSMQEHGPDPAE